MTAVAAAIGAFRDHPEPPEGATTNPFKLSSTVDEPASAVEIEQAWPGRRLPEQLVEAWSTARQARLFVDTEYGQWGLVLLSPPASAERTDRELKSRPSQYRASDLVIGEFLGDQELVVLADDDDGRGRVLIALPLDDRADWDVAAENLGQFLEGYFEHAGDKYWEQGAAT
jgi:hypothetical protein